MNQLKNWVRRSREEEAKAPRRYLAGWRDDLFMDLTHVLLTPAQLDEIKRECGRYDGTLPTGVFLGKMFLRGDCLCWFSISKENPMTEASIQCRTIQMVYEGGDHE